jgi:uncharacterized protein (AIM24 family)
LFFVVVLWYCGHVDFLFFFGGRLTMANFNLAQSQSKSADTRVANSVVRNFENGNRHRVLKLGGFSVIEHEQDLSLTPDAAMRAYFMSEMGVCQRQVVIELNGGSAVVQAGAMQWMLGNVNVKTGVKGVGDLFGKALRGKATGESAIKPEYEGVGMVVLEPTYKHIILEDVSQWGQGGIVVEDGMFLACDGSVVQSVQARSNVSSAVSGGEGLFNLRMSGQGVVALESRVPKAELVEIVLNNDVLKIDGPMAVAWSGSLDFRVERTTKSMIGSAASGEGLVNVYRGTGRVLMSPVA